MRKKNIKIREEKNKKTANINEFKLINLIPLELIS